MPHALYLYFSKCVAQVIGWIIYMLMILITFVIVVIIKL